jgi:hypothetical protein
VNDWIPSQVSLRDHPKTRRVSRTLGIPIPHVLGYLHCLWYWTLVYAPDGDIDDFDAQDIADAAEWEGDADAFLEALLNCGSKGRPGFLSRATGRLVVHDWEDNQGESFRARIQAAAKKRAQRAQQGQGREEVHEDGESVPADRDHVPKDEDSVPEDGDLARAPKTRPDQTGPDKTEEEEAPPAGSLLDFTVKTLPKSESTQADYRRVLERHEQRLPRSQIERIVIELAEWKPKKPRAQLHLTLNKWLAKEEPEKKLQERPDPPELAPIPELTEEQRQAQAEQARKAREMVSGLASTRAMP